MDMSLPEIKPKKAKKSDGKPINDIDWVTFDLRQCNRCMLCTSRCSVVPPKIVPNCSIMFVSDAPTETEDQFGTEPLVGAGGRLLDELLQEVGIDRNDCSAAQIIQCRPPANRPPTKEEIDSCYHILDKAIKDANPKLLVPLGALALERITGKKGITKLNGTVVEAPNYPNIKVVPVFHPSFVLRDVRNRDKLLYGLQAVKSVLSDGATSSYSDVTYVDTYEKFDLMVKDLEKSSRFSIDIETSGLDFINDYVICISFSCTVGKSYVLPWVVGNAAFYDGCREFLKSKRKTFVESVPNFVSEFRLPAPEFKWTGTDVKERLQKLFESPQIKLLHNFKFDIKFLRNLGFKFNETTIIDTMLISYVLDERRGIHSLKELAKKHTKFGNYEASLSACGFKQTERMTDTYAIIPIDVLSVYAGTDADATLQVYQKLMPRVLEEGLQNLLIKFLMPLGWLLLYTEERGFQIDNQYRLECIERLKNAAAAIDTQLVEYKMCPKDGGDPEPVKFTSNKELARFLFEHQNLACIELTEKGDPAVTEEVLEKLASLHPVPKLVLERRKYAKALSTYFEGIEKDMYSDGKVHPSFLQHGTETGRLSATHNNVQNLPRKTELLSNIDVNVRNLYVCSKPDDYFLFEADYSQAELRLIAEYSRDENLYRAFSEGKDPHAMLAVRIYHPELVAQMDSDPTFDAKKHVTKDERQNGKTANFSLAYGKWHTNFARENNLQPEVAEHIYNVYWATYQGVKRWQAAELMKARNNNNTFQTYFGRKRRLPQLGSDVRWERMEAERQGINFIIQAQASDYTLLSAMKIRNKCLELGIDMGYVSFVHDSIVGEVRKSQIVQLLNIMQEIMVHPPGCSIPMEFEVKAGYKLGACKVITKNETGWQIPT